MIAHLINYPLLSFQIDLLETYRAILDYFFLKLADPIVLGTVVVTSM